MTNWLCGCKPCGAKRIAGYPPFHRVNLHLVLSLPSYVSCLLHLEDLLIAFRWFIPRIGNNTFFINGFKLLLRNQKKIFPVDILVKIPFLFFSSFFHSPLVWACSTKKIPSHLWRSFSGFWYFVCLFLGISIIVLLWFDLLYKPKPFHTEQEQPAL